MTAIRSLTFAALAAALLPASASAVTIFSDDFSDGTVDPFLVNGDGQGTVVDSPDTDDADIDDLFLDGSNGGLDSPAWARPAAISTLGYTNIAAAINGYVTGFEGNVPDAFNLEYSLDGGVTYNVLDTTPDQAVGGKDKPVSLSGSLPAAAAQNPYVLVRAFTEGGDEEFWVDDFTVTGDVAATILQRDLLGSSSDYTLGTGQPSGFDESEVLTVNTVGYDQIGVEVFGDTAGGDDFNGNDMLLVQYSLDGGTNWNTIFTGPDDDDPKYDLLRVLPDEAEGVAALQVRTILDRTGDEAVQIDAFNVYGVIPEPASLALVGLGSLLVLTGRRRR